MSLFGSSPPAGDEPSTPGRARGGRGGGGGGGLFNDPEPAQKQSSNSLFADDDGGGGDDNGEDSPWSMPSPRKQKSRAEIVRDLLPSSDVPESYIDTYETVVRQNNGQASINPDGLAKIFSAARLSDASTQSRIVSLVAPDAGGSGDDVSLGRNEFNVLMALIGLAQEGEVISLDGVDERRRSKSCFCLLFFLSLIPTFHYQSYGEFINGSFFGSFVIIGPSRTSTPVKMVHRRQASGSVIGWGGQSSDIHPFHPYLSLSAPKWPNALPAHVTHSYRWRRLLLDA